MEPLPSMPMNKALVGTADERGLAGMDAFTDFADAASRQEGSF
jgi:hypothetical protein